MDPTREDFTQNGQEYDLILAANGYHPIFRLQDAPSSPTGTYVMTGGSMAQLFQAMILGPWHSRTGDQKMVNMLMKHHQKDLVVMKELIEAGKVKPVMDRHFRLRAITAIRYLEAGHAKGKVVITMEHNDKA